MSERFGWSIRGTHTRCVLSLLFLSKLKTNQKKKKKKKRGYKRREAGNSSDLLTAPVEETHVKEERQKSSVQESHVFSGCLSYPVQNNVK